MATLKIIRPSTPEDQQLLDMLWRAGSLASPFAYPANLRENEEVEIRKANPYHDRRGRFTSEDRDTGGGVSRRISAALSKFPPPPPRGSVVFQPQGGDVGSLLEDAERNLKDYDQLMSSVGALLGFQKVDSYEGFVRSLESQEGTVLVAGLKSRTRLEEKAKAECAGNYHLIGDVVRGTIAAPRMEDIPRVLSLLAKVPGAALAREPTDRFSRPTSAGYRDVLLNLRLSSGHVVEVQVNTKAMLKAKEKCHALYEEQRTIAARAVLEGRALSEAENSRMGVLVATQRGIYDVAKEDGR